MSTELSLANLDGIAGSVGRPTYQRDQLSPGIVHIGVGNFHRAHQAAYMDDLFNAGRDFDWAIVGAGMRRSDFAMRERLAAQDWLTTLVELDGDRKQARITGPMIDFLPVGGDIVAMIDSLADPAIRLVSLTITEGGYCIDPATGAFNPDHPEIRADVVDQAHPSGVFGLLTASLKARRAANIAPFTIVSCDNIVENGRVARDAVTGLAALVDPDLSAWIQDEVAFPNSMVDRVTPGTSERERAAVRNWFGIDDLAPVFCEPFRQWVIEDHFPTGRPAWEEVGVTLANDVTVYETMKLRILNGGHAMVAYAAALLGIQFVHDAMADPLVRPFLHKVESDEVIPVVPPVPGVDLHDYLALIEQRFANPGVGDTVARLCLDGSNRQPKFLLPSIRDRLRNGQSIGGLALASALWCRYCYGEDETGKAIEIDDVAADRLVAAARQARQTPAAFLALGDIYGDLAQDETFQTAFSEALTSLWQHGIGATLRAFTGTR